MTRRRRAIFAISAAALAAGALVVLAAGWLMWRMSISAEEAHVGKLAEALGQRTEHALIEAREILAGLDDLPDERCSTAHLQAMQDAAIGRPYMRSIGYWRAAERQCGIGFVEPAGLRPPRADRIYDSGVISWWPGPHTEVGGVSLFLMRYGDHDVAIDPNLLLDTGPLGARHAALWVEGLHLAGTGTEQDLPLPEEVAEGLTFDRDNNRVVSRYSRASIFPIDIVAVEPIESFRSRYLPAILAVIAAGMVLMAIWVAVVLRYSRYRMSLEGRLRDALAADRVGVHYQPILDTATGACVGAEALARWKTEEGEWISPAVFIPLVERSGLINELTLKVLARVLHDFSTLLRSESGFTVNLNLAEQDLRSDRFSEESRILMESAGVQPERIKLEITEQVLVDDPSTRARLTRLRARGHRLVIDDFGTGYSSLSSLERLELDALKIDKSFVDGIGTEAVTVGVINHIIEMANTLGLETVAEGIEKPDQVTWLVQHGVRYGQGFLYSKALPAAKFEKFMVRAGNATI